MFCFVIILADDDYVIICVRSVVCIEQFDLDCAISTCEVSNNNSNLKTRQCAKEQKQKKNEKFQRTSPAHITNNSSS